jgi:MFS family permease
VRLRRGAATFIALSNPNYRRFFPGQALSLIGTWMQTVALSWLVLELTGSGTALGLVTALERLPVLLVAPYGGVVADRVDKRRLLVLVQAMMASLALALGLLTVSGVVAFWHVCVLGLLLGLSNAFENPARQAFILEMVGPEDLRNAVALNSVIAAAARAVGPAVAGVLIAVTGTGVCFLVNAGTFVGVIYALLAMERATLRTTDAAPRARGQLREGLRYVARTPSLRVPLLMMAFVGMLTYEWQVVLPVVARDVFQGDASTYGWMTSAMGVGAVVGGLLLAGRGSTGLLPLTQHAAVFGIVILVAAVAPGLPLMLGALTLVGAASVAFLAVANSTLQLACHAEMRGRVMALFAVAFLGTTPIGGPIAGAVSEHLGGRWAMGMQGSACLLAAGFGLVVLRRARHPDPVTGTSTSPEPVLQRVVVVDPTE